MTGQVRRSRRSRLLVALSLLALAGLAPQPVSASATGTENIDLVLPTGISVSGTVRGPNDEVVEQAFAGFCDIEGSCFLADGAADETGAYVIGRVAPGTYTVMAGAPGYLNTWLGAGGTSVPSFGDATTVEITGETTLPTLHLDPGLSIAGTLTDPDGHGVAGVEVIASGYEGSGGGYTDADGQYLLTGLGAGFYSVSVYPPVGSPFTAGSISGGTIVREDFLYNVEVDGNETGIDATLVPGRTISGTVTGLSLPADINVSGTPHGRSLEIEPDGTFNATGLWPDELQTIVVTVRSTGGEEGQFPYGVYDGTPNLNPDQNAWVEIDISGGDVTGLTLAAPDLPKVTGTVIDDADAPVGGFITFCSDDLGCAAANLAGDGSFAFINLPDSTYRMYVVSNAHQRGYVTDGGGVSRAFEDAADIVVAGSDVVVDIVDPVGLHISGTISGPNDEPLDAASVGVSLESGEFIGSARTDANGEYVIAGLFAGDYFLFANGPEGGNYFGGYWSHAGYTAQYEEADLIAVPSDGVAIVSTNPVDGATGVVRTVQPSVTFSGSVDVSGAIASLTGGRVPVAMRGTVDYDDATHTLTFKPRGHLLPLSAYVFEVSGLTASGVPVAPVSVSFTTRR